MAATTRFSIDGQFTQPAGSFASKVDALTPNNLTVAASLDTATLGQEHALTPTNIIGASSLGTGTLGQTHALTPSNISVAANLGTPTAADVSSGASVEDDNINALKLRLSI